MYTYKAKLVRVVDGDTVYLEVDCGFYLKFTHSFRLIGINAPELKEAAGPAAKAWLLNELSCKDLTVNTFKADSFGRWLCEIYHTETANDPYVPSVNNKMIDAGHAVKYNP